MTVAIDKRNRNGEGEKDWISDLMFYSVLQFIFYPVEGQSMGL